MYYLAVNDVNNVEVDVEVVGCVMANSEGEAKKWFNVFVNKGMMPKYSRIILCDVNDYIDFLDTFLSK